MDTLFHKAPASERAHDGDRYFNTTAIGIIESDANYRVLRANPCVCNMLGYAEQNLQQMIWTDLFVPADLPRAREYFEPYFMRDETAPAFDQLYLTKSGKAVEVSVSVQPGPVGTDGRPAYYVGFVRDNRQRRQAEDEVQTLNRRLDDLRGTLDVKSGDVTARIEAQRENVESRRIFEDFFDNSDAAIIDYDFSILFGIVQGLRADGVRNLRAYIAESDERLQNLVDAMRINNANAPALRMLGVDSLQELGKLGELGKQSMNIVDIAEAMFLGETRLRRSEYLVAGGTPIPVVYSMRIPLTEEDARRVPIVIMDLSDIRLAEAARQATVAKSKFLSSMSHEIRTPLNGMIGNLELLALTSLDNDQFELVDDADKAAKALLGLVGNILDFSKIEAGKLTTEVGDINPALLVEEAVDVLQSRGRQKKIVVTAAFGPDVPTLVLGDAMRVRQILLNLIGNAVKFTEVGGVKISLTAEKWRRDACDLRFCIYDSGRGFDQI